MDVLVSPEVPTSHRIRDLQRQAKAALAWNNLFLGLDDEGLEMIAVITLGASQEEVLIDFGMRSTKDYRLRFVVGGDETGKPIPIEHILILDRPYIDTTLFCGIAERAAEATSAFRQGNSNALH